MTRLACMTVSFMDGTKAVFRYPKQSGFDAATISANVKRAIEAEKLVLEVDNDLLVIPTRNVKYIQVSPAPAHLPAGVFRQAKLVD